MEYYSSQPLPFRIGSKWGYINRRGAVICPPAFDSASCFRDGYAHVDKDGTLCVLNEHFQQCAALPGVISYSVFSDNLLAVEKPADDACFYIFPDGSEPFSLRATNNTSFANGRAFITNGKEWIMIDRSGSRISDFTFRSFYVFKDKENVTSVKLSASHEWALIDRDGEIASKINCDTLRIPSNGVVPFGRLQGGSIRYGLANYAGHEIVPPLFEEIDDCISDGMIGVECENGMWGIVNLTGEWVIEPSYVYIGSCGDNLFLAYANGNRTPERTLENGKFGFVSKENRVVIDFQFDTASPMLNGIASVGWFKNSDMSNEKYGFVTREGQVIWREQ